MNSETSLEHRNTVVNVPVCLSSEPPSLMKDEIEGILKTEEDLPQRIPRAVQKMAI